jgi:copper transport protein
VVSIRARLALGLALAAAAAGAAAPAASAHATLETTSPERGAVLEKPPEQVTLGFDEPVEAAFGAVRVFDASGTQVRTGPLRRPGGDDSRLAVALPSSLKQGAYTVTYRVVSADGHPISGGLTFRYGEAATAGAEDVATLLEGTSAGPVSRAANGVARGLGYLAIAVVLGALAFVALCWRPVVGGERELAPAADALQERLVRLVAGGLALGTVAGAAAIVLQAAVAGEMSAWTALDPSVIREVLGTRTGAMLGVRLAAWCALAVALIALHARPSCVTAAVAAVPAAAIVAGPALAGHATTQTPVAVLAPADIVHVAATAVWIGGLVTLLLAVPAATRRLEPPMRTRVLAGVLARFSPLALWSVVALALTGVVQAAFHLDWSLAPLADTAFGRSLLVKAALFTALLGLGATQRRRIIPALRGLASGGAAPGGAGVLLRRALRAEVLLLLGVLAATAILVGSPPPRAVAGAAAGPYSADVALGPERLQMTIDPASPGANEVHIYLLDGRTGAPFTGSKELRVDATLPAKGIGPLHLDVRPAGPGHWLVTDAQLAPAGNWRLTVTNRVSDFDEYEAHLKVPVR